MKWMREIARWLVAATLLGSGLAAQAAPQADYVLGVGDLVRVTVYQNPDLTLETRINEGGTISYPLLGSVKVGGLSVVAAEKKIADGLREGNYLKQPQVTILLMAVKANQVSVLGLVNKPGRYPLEAGTSKLSEVLAAAGGTVAGSASEIVVISGLRNGKPFRKEIDFPKVFASMGTVDDIPLENGDAIWVDRAPQIYIYGEVQRPGVQILLRDTTLLQALASAGGLNMRGTERGIRVHRRDESGEVKIVQPGMNDRLQPGDVVYVRESLF
ncbi:polysaccharide export protein EpsE [Aquabacterium olei]|nr:polysaccharide export protein EpsE [Aquabacterium olei]